MTDVVDSDGTVLVSWSHNPGSNAAIQAGCTCAVVDNHYGREAPWPPDGWWITARCPVHDPSPYSTSNVGVRG